MELQDRLDLLAALGRLQSVQPVLGARRATRIRVRVSWHHSCHRSETGHGHDLGFLGLSRNARRSELQSSPLGLCCVPMNLHCEGDEV
jgi:hypothetical protein